MTVFAIKVDYHSCDTGLIIGQILLLLAAFFGCKLLDYWQESRTAEHAFSDISQQFHQERTQYEGPAATCSYRDSTGHFVVIRCEVPGGQLRLRQLGIMH